MSVTSQVGDSVDHFFPSSEQIFGWIKDLASLGHRKTGTPQGRASAEYIARHFRAVGLESVRIEPAPTPCPEVRTQRLVVANQPIESFWINATGRHAETGSFRTELTDPRQEIVYLGRGEEEDFAGRDVVGKIVLCDVEFHQGGPGRTLERHPRGEIIDPDNTFSIPRNKYDIYSPNTWPDNYFRAQRAGAAGFVGTLTNYMDCYNYNEDYSENGFSFGSTWMAVPGVWVSRNDGDRIKSVIAEGAGAANASLVLDVAYEMRDALNVVGELAGHSEDAILVHSHHDAVFAGAVQDASGVSEVMALAAYFAQLPISRRPKSMMFAATDTHFTNYTGHQAFIAERQREGRRILVDLCVEHIGNEVELDDENRAVETGMVEPRVIYVSDSSGLLDAVRDAVVSNGLDRTILLPVDSAPGDPDAPYEFRPDEIISDAYYFAEAGIPVVSLVAGQMYLFHPSDTPDRIAVDQLRPVGLAFAQIAHAAAGHL